MRLSLEGGKVSLVFVYGEGQTLRFITTNTYNSGNWVKLEAARAVRGESSETGVLRVIQGGEREDLMDTMMLVDSFKMEDCLMYFGGLPPGTSFGNMQLSAKETTTKQGFLGQIRGITVSNPGTNSPINPLHAVRGEPNPFFGVSPVCERMASTDEMSLSSNLCT